MKCTIPEISWHNRDPVLSVDLQQCKLNKDDKTDKIYWRLATGGADSHVLVCKNIIHLQYLHFNINNIHFCFIFYRFGT